jgi:hypothetical protein
MSLAISLSSSNVSKSDEYDSGLCEFFLFVGKMDERINIRGASLLFLLL